MTTSVRAIFTAYLEGGAVKLKWRIPLADPELGIIQIKKTVNGGEQITLGDDIVHANDELYDYDVPADSTIEYQLVGSLKDGRKINSSTVTLTNGTPASSITEIPEAEPEAEVEEPAIIGYTGAGGAKGNAGTGGNTGVGDSKAGAGTGGYTGVKRKTAKPKATKVSKPKTKKTSKPKATKRRGK